MRSNLQQLLDAIDSSPVIPAIKSEDELELCLKNDNPVVFLISDTINTVSDDIKRLKDAGKIVLVHIDLIEGLSAKDAAVDFLAANTDVDGIITTKPQLIRHAHEIGLFAVQRFFALDSKSLENGRKHASSCNADMVEILPGLMPKIISRICREMREDGMVVPLVAGGLISEKEDVVAALAAGAVAVSTTNPAVWSM